MEEGKGEGLQGQREQAGQMGSREGAPQAAGTARAQAPQARVRKNLGFHSSERGNHRGVWADEFEQNYSDSVVGDIRGCPVNGGIRATSPPDA